jgi:hypothetical protein
MTGRFVDYFLNELKSKDSFVYQRSRYVRFFNSSEVTDDSTSTTCEACCLFLVLPVLTHVCNFLFVFNM